MTYKHILTNESIEHLTDSLQKHIDYAQYGIKVDKKLFSDVLSSVGWSESFYNPLPTQKQRFDEQSQTSTFSLDYLLVNRLLLPQFMPKRNLLQRFFASLDGYSPENVARGLLKQEDVLSVLHSCQDNFSLLGTFQTIDYVPTLAGTYTSSGKVCRNIFVTRNYPILIIPGQENNKQVIDWEKASGTIEPSSYDFWDYIKQGFLE